MKIPFANRTVDIDLPNVDGLNKITVKMVIDDFLKQMPENFNTLLEAFVLISPRKVRVTCKTPHAMEEFCHSGLTFRSSPIVIRPCNTAKWVHISRLSYGIPEDAVRRALEPYGKIFQFKMETYRGVYIGTRSVLMELSNPIPSRLLIAGHWCNAFYVGQVPTCFSCHKSGHSFKDCPDRQNNDGNPVIHRRIPSRAINTSTVQSIVPASTGNNDAPAKDCGTAPSAVDGAARTRIAPPTVNNLPIPDAPTLPHKDGLPEDSAKSSKGPKADVMQDQADSSDEEIFVDVREYVEDAVIPAHQLVGSKRGRTEEDSSDDALTLPEKRGKAVPPDPRSEPLPLSPNKFAALVDEAANVPLPDDNVAPPVDEDANSNMAMDETGDTLPAEDYDGDDDSYSDDEREITKPDTPKNPDIVDDLPSSASANDILDSPLSQVAAADSQPSSPAVDSFVLGITSKRTQPAPVVGSSRRTHPKGTTSL